MHMAGTTSQRLGEALPDAIAALGFLWLWIAPLSLGAGFARAAAVVLVLEFIMIMAALVLGRFVFEPQGTRLQRRAALLGTIGFLLLPVVAIAVFTGELWPFASFAWLLVAKLSLLRSAARPSHAARVRQQELQALAMLVYVGALFLALIVPWPALGMSETVARELLYGDDRKELFRPHFPFVTGALYFTTMAFGRWRLRERRGADTEAGPNASRSNREHT